MTAKRKGKPSPQRSWKGRKEMPPVRIRKETHDIFAECAGYIVSTTSVKVNMTDVFHAGALALKKQLGL